MDHKVSTLNAFPTLSVCICHIVKIQEWMAFPRNPQLHAALEHSDILYIYPFQSFCLWCQNLHCTILQTEST